MVSPFYRWGGHWGSAHDTPTEKSDVCPSTRKTTAVHIVSGMAGEARSQQLGFIMPRKFWKAQCLIPTGTPMEQKAPPDLRNE